MPLQLTMHKPKFNIQLAADFESLKKPFFSTNFQRLWLTINRFNRLRLIKFSVVTRYFWLTRDVIAFYTWISPFLLALEFFLIENEFYLSLKSFKLMHASMVISSCDTLNDKNYRVTGTDLSLMKFFVAQ